MPSSSRHRAIAPSRHRAIAPSRHRANMQDFIVRFYIYVSRSKLDMLHAQIPGVTKGAGSTELGFDLKVVKGSRRRDEPSADVYDRLSELEEWIGLNEPVGTADDPDSWIHYRGEVTAANFTERPDRDGTDMATQAVIFAAETEAGSRLLLGGSGYNLIAAPTFGIEGEGGPNGLYYSWSVGLLRLLETYRDDMDHPVSAPQRPRPLQEHQAATLVSSTCAELIAGRFRSQNLGVCDVLAKRLGTYDVSGRKVSMGTPLYVSTLE